MPANPVREKDLEIFPETTGSVESLLPRLEPLERVAAQVGHHSVGEVDGPSEKEETSYVKVELCSNPLLWVFSRHQAHKEHVRQPNDGLVQHDPVANPGFDLDGGIEIPAVDPLFYVCPGIQFHRGPAAVLRN